MRRPAVMALLTVIVYLHAALATAARPQQRQQQRPETIQVEVGDRVKLACPRGKGSRQNLHEADFRWYHTSPDTTRLIMVKAIRSDKAEFIRADPGMVLKENKLVIRAVQYSNAGHYGCFVLRPRPSRWHNYTLLVTRPPEEYETRDDYDEYYYDDYEEDWYGGDYYMDDYGGDYGGGGSEVELDKARGSYFECQPWYGDVEEGNTTERTTADRVAADRVTTDRVTTDRVAADRVAADRVTTDRVTVDRLNSTGRITTAGPGTTRPTTTTTGERQRMTTGRPRPRAPYFEDPASLQRVLRLPLGYWATIHCPVKGFPSPRIQWRFNSVPVEEFPQLTSKGTLGRTCLHLPDINGFNEGTYSCRAENGLGAVNHSVKLVVTKDAVETFPYIESGSPHNVTALAGGPVSFRCPGSWDWEMDLFWVFSRTQTFGVEDVADLARVHQWAVSRFDSRYDISIRDELTIRNASAADTGFYTCIKNNQLGFAYGRAHLDIVPEVPPMSLSVQPLNVSVTPGNSITLNCPAGADTPSGGRGEARGEVTVFWVYTEDEPPRLGTVQQLMQAQRTALVSDKPSTRTDPWPTPRSFAPPSDPTAEPPTAPHQLTLADLAVSDTGFYTCVAYSSRSVSQAWTYITVAEAVPAQPLMPWFTSRPWLVPVSLAALLVVIIPFCAALLRRHSRDKKTIRALTRRVLVEYGPDSLLPRVRIEGCTVDSGCSPPPAFLLPSDPHWELDRQRLKLAESLGEGCFGRVLRAHLSQPGGGSETVAVKMLKESYSDSDLLDLVSEMELMKRIGRHVNIVNLLGTCTRDGTPMVVLEYAPYGNLQKYLRERRQMPMYERPFDLVVPSVYDLVQFSFQAARGMEYLAIRKCVHRDLAARNVLVADERTVKIADFGLARDLRHKDYYRKVTDGRLPVKWMAPEALTERIYTSQSDVWSFGVLLWEIVTMGAMPYPGLQSVRELIDSLKDGHRLHRPDGCPEPLYDVMLQCWLLEAAARPTFCQLVEQLGDMVAELSPEEYVVMGSPQRHQQHQPTPSAPPLAYINIRPPADPAGPAPVPAGPPESPPPAYVNLNRMMEEATDVAMSSAGEAWTAAASEVGSVGRTDAVSAC